MTKYLASSTGGAQIFSIICLIASILGIYAFGFDLSTLLLVVLGYFIYGCLGVVVTYHRGLTHNSYKTNPFITKLFSFFGSLGGTGSPLAWVAIHLIHHTQSDKEGDPHSPLHKGIKIFSLDYPITKEVKWRMRSLVVNRYQQFLHRYYFLILALWSLMLFLLGGFYLVIFLHLMPALITIIMSNVVNYIGHKPNWWGGYRTYNLKDQSTTNWLWSIPSWGETWHNNHHRHPKNFSCGEKWWELDISALIIRLIKV